MSESQKASSDLVRQSIVRYLMALLFLAALFFLTAGTLRYWEAWVYLGIIFIPMLFVLIYLVRNDPELLERRMRMRERRQEQSVIIKLAIFVMALAFVLPGLDKRFGWSNPSVPVILIADLVVLIGYGIVFLVFRENRYAARTVEVDEAQKVISSGPYAIIRHPMYIGMLLMYGFSPLALGSYWAVLPALILIPIIVARIVNEEKVLRQDLEGYEEYTQKTRYRLIPGIW
jgi:protein-S-isoprenylcysteine O-methyltransferase Ste14